MAYIVNQDIIDRVGNTLASQLTTESGSVPSSTVLDGIRDDAEGEADGYFSRRGPTPVDLTGDTRLAAAIKGIVLDIAVYHLRRRRPPVPADVRTARDDAIDWLTKVSEGKVVLPAIATPAKSVADGVVFDSGSKGRNAADLRDL